ncbi:hypothetical protein P3T43_006608 [Paraburkholderia sp. GAS41]
MSSASNCPFPLRRCAVATMDVFEFRWSEFEPGIPVPGSGGQGRGHAKMPPEGLGFFSLKKSENTEGLLPPELALRQLRGLLFADGTNLRTQPARRPATTQHLV